MTDSTPANGAPQTTNGCASQRTNGSGPHTPRLTLRPALRGDRVPLNFFFDAMLREDYFLRRGQLDEMLTGRRHRVLVAEIDGVLVGVAVLTRGARLVNALIHPAYRGLGLGRALVEHSGAAEVRAKIDGSGGDSRPFYRRLGFVRTGEMNAKGNVELMRRPVRRADRRRAAGAAVSTRNEVIE